MNPELLKMLNEINEKKVEARNFVENNQLEEAKKAKDELVQLQNKFEIAKDLYDEQAAQQAEDVTNRAKNDPKNKRDENTAFVNVFASAVLKRAANEADMEIYNTMTEADPNAEGESDGGLTVPKDIRTQIKEFRRQGDALEPLVNVEPVSTLSGSRVVEVTADHIPFDNVEEAAQFPEVGTPKFNTIAYKVIKKGGILKVTRELLQDTAENILAYLRKWIGNKARVTRNYLILAQLDASFGGTKTKAISTFDEFKDIYNVNLDPSIALTSGCLTNQDGFNWLDKQKDADGNYMLQKDPTNATRKLLFGQYPVKVVSNKVLKSENILDAEGTTTGYKYPFYMGDLKEAITIFDRESLSIEFSTEAGDLWSKDLTGVKVRERLDIQTIDTEAVVKGTVEVDANGVTVA